MLLDKARREILSNNISSVDSVSSDSGVASEGDSILSKSEKERQWPMKGRDGENHLVLKLAEVMILQRRGEEKNFFWVREGREKRGWCDLGFYSPFQKTLTDGH
jgi:hypothetical protein